jgi:TPR repeat protein
MLAECQKAAEQGSPIAQMILSQLYWTRQASASDVLLAYKWSLIASAQVSRTSKSFSKTMTMEQLLYAEKMAADFLRKTHKIPPTPITEINERVPVALSAASD